MSYKSENFLNLGKKTSISYKPDRKLLEKVKNPKINIQYCIRLSCPEFTSICPITSQPDFANIIIDYIPNKYIVESKSFKFYLLSYRNHGAFHEDCTITIAQDLQNILKPNWLRITAFWFPRGGIPIDIFWQTSEKPEKILIPEINYRDYKGRD